MQVLNEVAGRQRLQFEIHDVSSGKHLADASELFSVTFRSCHKLSSAEHSNPSVPRNNKILLKDSEQPRHNRATISRLLHRAATSIVFAEDYRPKVCSLQSQFYCAVTAR